MTGPPGPPAQLTKDQLAAIANSVTIALVKHYDASGTLIGPQGPPGPAATEGDTYKSVLIRLDAMEKRIDNAGNRLVIYDYLGNEIKSKWIPLGDDIPIQRTPPQPQGK